MRCTHVVLVPLLIVALTPGATSGQMSTDRPLNMVWPSVVGSGVLQVETGLLFRKMRDDVEQYSVPTRLRVGIGEAFELRGELAPVHRIQDATIPVDGASGLGDAIVGVKWSPVREGSGENAARAGLLLQAILPTGDDEFMGGDRVKPALLGTLGVPISNSASVAIMAGFATFEDVEDDLFLGTGVFAAAVRGRGDGPWGFFAEVAVTRLRYDSGLDQIYGSAGLTHHLTPDQQIDVAFARRAANGGDNARVSVGYSRRFGN